MHRLEFGPSDHIQTSPEAAVGYFYKFTNFVDMHFVLFIGGVHKIHRSHSIFFLFHFFKRELGQASFTYNIIQIVHVDIFGQVPFILQ